MKGRLRNADEFEDIIVKIGTDGRVVRVKDIARVELGALSYSAQGYADRYPAVIVVVDQQPGSNAVRATQGIKDAMAEMAKSFPKGLEYRITYNPTEFIEVSITQALHDHPGGDRAGGAGGAAVPQDLARHADSGRRHPRVADRHVRGHAGVRLLAQHADAVRAGAGGRHRRRRRHRRGGERRAQAEGGPDARWRRRACPWTRSARRWSPSRWCCWPCSFRPRSSAASPGSSTGSSRSPSPRRPPSRCSCR